MGINDGGPAFPQMRVWNAERSEYEDTAQYPGMSMRAWLIGQALAGSASQFSPLLDDDEAAKAKVERAALVADLAIAEIEKSAP